MIKPETVQEIISIAKVDEIVAEYVNLKRRGVNMVGLCPFHNEKTPSFTVSPSKNLYKCFGCGKGGSAVSFLMEHESFTYPEALRFLAKRYGIQIKEEVTTDEAIEEQKRRESLLLINQFACEFFENQLNQTDEGQSIGLSYFKHRGLIDSTIKNFHLGYAPRGPRSLLGQAIQKGYNRNLLEELGLVTQSGYDFYRERIVFPFHNLSGKVIGFGARILNDAIKSPKYLNSPESEIYNKRKTLYGLYQAKSEIRKKDQCILVEGYTDVLSLWQNGLKNVVASSGTSLTHDQVRMIRRFTLNCLVIYDGDEAGQQAALRGLNIFLENDVDVRVVSLPPKADPDSYIRQIGFAAFTEFLTAQSQDFILLLAHRIEKEYGHDPIMKSRQIKDLVESLSRITDQLKRSLYIKECSKILNVEEGTLVRETNKQISSLINKKKFRSNIRPQFSRPQIDYDPTQDHSQGIRITVDTTNYQERDIIRILLLSGDKIFNSEHDVTVGEYIITNLLDIIDLISDETNKKILKEYHERLQNRSSVDQQYFLNHSDPKVSALAIDLLVDPYSYANWSERGVELQTQKPVDENYIKDSYQSIMRFKLQKINERLKELKSIIERAEEDITPFLLAYQKLEGNRKVLASELRLTVL